ncbi:MAG TPA: OB-fold domain-containing protein [Acidimicrobiales bacterium]|nr:OB-fold domain-containing protein [Acidimicrobiales bacterium]
MAYVSLEEELFRVDGETATLLGSRCPECRRSFFPRRRRCAVDFTSTEDVELSREGTLYTYTYVRVPFFGKRQVEAEGGYGVGQVDLPEGVRIQTVLQGDPTDWRIGMPMQIDLEVTGEDDGDDIVIFRFRAKDSADA